MGGMAIRRVAGWLGWLSIVLGSREPSTVVAAEREEASRDEARRDEIRQVLFFSGLCGLLLGLACGWQIAVESAQAVAGLASYPADNPFYMYHLKSWTLLHQLPALLLLCGMPESWLSMLLSGLAGIVSFQAIALCAFAFSRDRLLAGALPLVCHVTNACRDLESVHQIRLLSSECWLIYGVVGASYVIYAWSLLGIGYRRSGALMLGLAPAVHPVLGCWCLSIGAFSLAWNRRRDAQAAKSPWRWLAAGVCLSALSFAAQCLIARGIPAVDSELTRRLAAAFARDWDNHRVPVPINHLVVVTAACATALGAVYLRFATASLPSQSIVLLRCLTVSASLGLLLGLLTNVQDDLPLPLVMAMPGRFNDVIAVAFPALALGLLARRRSNLALHAVFSLVMVYCLLKSIMMTKHDLYVPSSPKVMLAVGLGLLLVAGGPMAVRRAFGKSLWHLPRGGALAGLLAAAYAWRRDDELAMTICIASVALLLLSHSPRLWRGADVRILRWRIAPALLYSIDAICLVKIATSLVGPWFALGLAAGAACLARRPWLPIVARGRAPARGFRAAFALVLAGLSVGLAGTKLVERASERHSRLYDWNNDPLLAAISRGTGLTLTASRIELLQLQTRRGVLLYGAAMNQLTYVPASAPKMNEILRKVYGEDLLRPRPASWVRCGGLMMDSGRELWARREPEEWTALGREFGFTDVVTYADWTTKLPLVARNRKYAIYRVPDSAASEDPAAARHSLARLPSSSASITSDTSLPNVGE